MSNQDYIDIDLKCKNSNDSKTFSNVEFLSDEDEFYDALSDESDDRSVEVGEEYESIREFDTTDSVTMPVTSKSKNQSNDLSKLKQAEKLFHSQTVGLLESQYRTTLPIPMFKRDEISIWSIFKQCIGKELSKITMPVVFNEPLSFVQRLCEYMEYSCILEQACMAKDSIKRMEYVAAFAVSALASQLERTGKPFNPLLGETYENQRPDVGFNWVSEQVSHHPPISAFHAEGTNRHSPFAFYGSVHPMLRFWGKSVEIEPKGTIFLELLSHEELYSWTNPKCSVHNVVVGKLWIEHHGVVEIVNHRTNERCVVTFKPYSWFRNDLNKVEGFIFTENKKKIRVLEGDWTKYFYAMSVEAHGKYVSMMKNKASSRKTKSSSVSSAEDVHDIFETLREKEYCNCLWRVRTRPKISSQMHNMTEFAMSLNQEEVQGYDLPPTDSRLRPDQRALENGDIDGASEKKHRLEEKQREARKIRLQHNTEWTPRWFKKERNEYTNSLEWVYNGRYNTRDWSNSPDIF